MIFSITYVKNGVSKVENIPSETSEEASTELINRVKGVDKIINVEAMRKHRPAFMGQN